MKKLIYITIVALLGCMALTSCLETSKKGEQLTTELYIKSSQDLIDVCNIVVTYKDKGGINATDTVRDSVWTKTVVSDVVPFKVGLRWALSAKPVSQIAKDSLQLRAKYTIEHKGWDCPIGEMFMFNHSNFPVSKLAALCDYENLNNAEYWDGDHGCNMIVLTTGSHPVLTITPVPWDDK